MREALTSVPAYKAGQAPSAVAGVTSHKLSSNENPYEPLPSVVEAVAQAAASMNRYPDPTSSELVGAIAHKYDADPDEVIVGTGAVALIYQIAQTFTGPGDEIVYAWRSFEAYPIVTAVAGATATPVPLTDRLTHDLDAMADALTARTRVVLLCTPNNPTGTTISAADFQRFMQRVPDDVLVVLDEAYVEFCRDGSAVNGLTEYRNRHNVLVLRTFSKAYGLAGLRVGYGLGPAPIIAALRRTSLPFGVTAAASAAAVASLAAEDELSARVDAVVEQRIQLVERLRQQGWSVADSEANFVWLTTGEQTGELVNFLDRNAVATRPFAGEGVRITVGSQESNDRLIELLCELTPLS